MVKTRRSFDICSPSCLDPSKRHHILQSDSPLLQGIQAGHPFKEVLHKSIRQLFTLGAKGYWFQILPSGDSDDLDITHCLGVEWDTILLLIMYDGLISFWTSSVVNEGTVHRIQWDNLGLELKKYELDLNITNVRQKNKRRVYYFCIGKPIFNNILHQHKALISLSDDRPLERRQLLRDIQVAKTRILNSRNLIRFEKSSGAGNSQSARRRKDTVDEDLEFAQEVSSRFEKEIEFALALDLTCKTRMSRTNGSKIIIKSRMTQADENARQMCIHTAILWGWQDPYLSYKERSRIAKAACNQVAYDHGYQRRLAHTSLPIWYSKIIGSIDDGEDTNPISPCYAGIKKYIDKVEEIHPGYMVELFRFAQKIKGPVATFTELALCMNEKSAAPSEEQSTLSLTKYMLRRWFQTVGGGRGECS